MKPPSSCLFPEFEAVNKAILENKVINLPTPVKQGKKSYGTTVATSNYYPGASTHVACKHPGDKVIFEFEGKKLYASNLHTLDEKSGKWDLIIDLANVVWVPRNTDHFVKEGNHKRFIDNLRKWCGKVPNPVKSEVLKLDWADMQPPPAKLDFWIHLWDLLPEKSVIACHGGHGRTGTCLAALMIAAGDDYYSAVQAVRSDHCDRAIETQGQEMYLHNLYVEMLERALKIAKGSSNENDAKDIIKDLEFARSHVPTYQDSYGRVKKDAKKPVNDVIDDVVWPPKEENGVFTTVTGAQLKQEGGKIYSKECINSLCTDPDCKIEAHKVWVQWSDVEDEFVEGYGNYGH